MSRDEVLLSIDFDGLLESELPSLDLLHEIRGLAFPGNLRRVVALDTDDDMRQDPEEFGCRMWIASGADSAYLPVAVIVRHNGSECTAIELDTRELGDESTQVVGT